MQKSIIFSVLFAMVALPFATITLNSTAQADHDVPACEFLPMSGRTIVHFTKDIRSDKGESEASGGTYYVSIPEGNYKISLMSYDNHSDKPNQTQPNEQWYLMMGNIEGDTVGTTDPIDDLPNNANTKSQVVEPNFDLWDDISWIGVFHHAYGDPDTYSSNSIRPVCAAFDRVSSNPAPTVDIEANESDGPISIDYNATAQIRWSSHNTTSCKVTPTSWTGIWGYESTGKLTSSQTYSIYCTGPGGSATDSVTVNVKGMVVKPIAVTSPASHVDRTTTKLNGVALPGHAVFTQGWFEWGQSTSLGNKTKKIDLGSNYSMNFSDMLYGLQTDTTFYFRAVVENQNGIAYGNILTIKFPLATTYKETSPDTTTSTKSLTVTKEVAGSKEATVAGGGKVEYSIIAKNTGSATLAHVVITDTLSPFVEFVSATDNGTYDSKTQKVTWNIGSLNAGASKTLKVTVTAKQNKDALVATGKASGKADGVSTRDSNDVTVRINPSASTDTFSISNPGEFIRAGETIDYTVRFENKNSSELKNVEVRIILPATLEYDGENADFSRSGNTITWDIGDMPAGQERTATFSVKVDEDARKADSVVVTAIASHGEGSNRQQETASTLSAIEGGSDEDSDDDSASAFFPNIPFFDGTLGKVITWLIIIILGLLMILLGLWVYDKTVQRRMKRQSQSISIQ